MAIEPITSGISYMRVHKDKKAGDFMRIGFVGAGKVGFTLGKYMAEHDVHVSGYYSRSESNARQATEFTNSHLFTSMEELVEASDAIFLTVSDGAIADVWEEIRHFSIKGKCICHCSGAMSTAVFSGINQTGASGYSIHPLFAIDDKLQSYRNISQAYFTIEGNQEHLEYWKTLFEGFGNPVKLISEDNKVLYHSAAVCASNLVVGLYEMATELLQECGFEQEEAAQAISPLFINNARNICNKGTVEALTGPLERADAGTISRHIQAMNEEQKDVYKALSRELIKVASRKNPDRDYSEIHQLLDKDMKSENIK